MVEQWFSKRSNVRIPLRVVNIMFGIPYKKTQDNVLFILNFIILHGKWFIYKCKRDKKPLIFVAFLKYLKYVQKIEKDIATIRNNERDFGEKWSLMNLEL